MFENVEGHLLSVLLCMWARACVFSLYLCICSFVLAYVGLFLRLCIHRFWLAYTGSYLRMWALTHVCEALGKGLTLLNFSSFSIVSLLYEILTPLFVILHLNITASFFLSLFLHRKHHFSSFSLESRI